VTGGGGRAPGEDLLRIRGHAGTLVADLHDHRAVHGARGHRHHAGPMAMGVVEQDLEDLAHRPGARGRDDRAIAEADAQRSTVGGEAPVPAVAQLLEQRP
jgi:hypothetical protein